jgi:hypothetical protein
VEAQGFQPCENKIEEEAAFSRAVDGQFCRSDILRHICYLGAKAGIPF